MSNESTNNVGESDRHAHSSFGMGLTAQRLAVQGVFLLLFFGMILLAWNYSVERRELRVKISSLEQDLTQLQQVREQLDVANQSANEDQQLISNFLRLCRNVTDIPNWHCDRILASANGFENLCLFVPDGQHTLIIHARWTSTDYPDAEQSGREKTWRIPLQPHAGYWVNINTPSEGLPVGWVLSSNHPAFPSQRAVLPLANFSGNGMSQRSTKSIQYPNQIENSFRATQDPDSLLNSVDVFHLALHGEAIHPVAEDDRVMMDGQLEPTEIEFNMRIESDGPPVVAASDADKFYILKSPIQLNYLGKGMYGLERD